MTRTTDIVDVDLGDRTYPILIGRDLLPALGALIADMLPRKRVFVIADETVARLHGPSLDAGLAEAGIHGVTVLIPPGGRVEVHADAGACARPAARSGRRAR
jgi:3-dehydroquinate synthase